MATVANSTAVRTEQVEETAGALSGVVKLSHIGMAFAGLTVFWVAVRIYQQVFGWTKGLDSFSPEFRMYWWNLLLAEFALEGSAAVLLWG